MVKYFAIFVVVALALLSVLTIRFSQDYYKILPLENSDPAKIDLEKYNFQDWKEFDAPNGKFQVMFPTIPQQATENIIDPKSGQNRNYDMYVSERLNGTIFMISLITFESNPDPYEQERLMTEMMDDMVSSNSKNELLSKSYGEFQGNPSLDYSISSVDASIDAKTFMVGNTMYVLTRVVPSTEKDPSEFNFFINSFELTEQ